MDVVGFNCTLDISKKFFDIYLSHYTKDTIYNLPNKTDCHAFDNTRKLVQVKERNKNDGHDWIHIIARDKEINPYIDHKKDPNENIRTIVQNGSITTNEK